MSIRLRLTRLEATGGETEGTLLITTGVPHDDVDDGTGPTVARLRGEWIPREPGEPPTDFLARVGCNTPRKSA